jgi:hypothetical protein
LDHSHLGSSTSQPPPTALASAPLIPFISCADRCTVLGPRRIRLLAHYLDCTVAHTTAQTPLSSCTHARPPPHTAPARPDADMGSYTFRWYVISAPPSFDSKGQGCELGHGTAARVRAG